MEGGTNAIVLFLMLLRLPRVTGNHNLLWRCGTECKNCGLKTMSLDNPIKAFYGELFSRQPPTSLFRPTFIHSGANPRNQENVDWLPRSSSPPFQHSDIETLPFSKCCETEFSHMVLNTTEHEGSNYTVVHLTDEYQFIPVGKCRTGTDCALGTCFQRYRPHWVLVYNRVKTRFTSPLRFIPASVPSFCQCVDVGTRRTYQTDRPSDNI